MKNNLRKILEKILKFFAYKLLRDLKPDIIGITGSVGKSSTKEAIYKVLSENFKGKVWKNFGNLNEEIGVPLSVFGFQNSVRWFMWPIVLVVLMSKFLIYRFRIVEYPKILVLELSANKVGDIDYLTSFIKPHIAVITAIGPAHMEFFKSLDNIVKEKGRLVEALGKNDYAILNRDDRQVKNINKRTIAKIIYYNGGKIGSEKEPARIIGKIYKINQVKIEKSLQRLANLPHRLNIINTKDEVTIIDDTYNANPLSVERALEKLQKLKIENCKLKINRRVAVLGDMLELGNYAKEAHLEVAKHARAVADLLITVGPNFLLTKSDYHFDNSAEAAGFLLKEARKGDIILVKGSRGMKMEHVVDTLRTTNTDTKHHEILV